MSNSPLIDCTILSPNCCARTAKVDTITIHHMANDWSVEKCGREFTNPTRQASANYGVDTEGRIGLYVDESKRAWTSSNWKNDDRAVTIEVANDGKWPDWHVSDKALEATIALCVDICQRNNIPRLNYTGWKDGNLTMHKWFAATLCPGPYLESKFPYIAEEVNRRLNGSEPETEEPNTPKEEEQLTGQVYCVQVGVFKTEDEANRHLDELKKAGFNGYVTVTMVEATPESKPNTPEVEKPKEEEQLAGQVYCVQVGAYNDKHWAELRCKAVEDAGFKASVVGEGKMWRVHAGAFKTRNEATQHMTELKKAGFNGFVTAAIV